MLPTTLLLGLAFPIGLSLWAGDDPSDDTSRRVGAFYSLNVFGAIRIRVPGFVLLPALGSRNSLIVVSALATPSSIALACRCGSRTRRFALRTPSSPRCCS